MMKIIFLFTLSFFFFNLHSQCNIGNCTNGWGKYSFSSGTLYLGYFQNGELDGKGMVSWEEGIYHIGNYSKGVRHGEGFYTSKKGISVGSWHNGDKHGEFLELFFTGECYLVTFYYGQDVKQVYFRDCISNLIEASRLRDNLGMQILDKIGIGR